MSWARGLIQWVTFKTLLVLHLASIPQVQSEPPDQPESEREGITELMAKGMDRGNGGELGPLIQSTVLSKL